jgi:GDP-L-fucose synthase
MAINLTEQRILVTGGAGFLGKRIVRRLADIGCREILVPRRAEFDLTTANAVEKLFRAFRPDVVIHAAAVVGGIGANRANPGSYFYDNAMMGLHVIEAARVYRAKKLVVLGTICSYPKYTPVPFREEDLWNGYPEETNAPYGIAKKALLVQCQAYRQQYGMNAVFLLPVNLYGPGDNFDLESSHVVPALIRKCVEAARTGADRIECWGDGSATREFLYVDDAAEGVLQATTLYDKADPVNLGAGSEISIRELAGMIARLTSFRGSIAWDVSQPNGQPRRCLSTDRAAREFGFRASIPLELGLQKTIDWYTAEAKVRAAGQ